MLCGRVEAVMLHHPPVTTETTQTSQCLSSVACWTGEWLLLAESECRDTSQGVKGHWSGCDRLTGNMCLSLWPLTGQAAGMALERGAACVGRECRCVGVKTCVCWESVGVRVRE